MWGWECSTHGFVVTPSRIHLKGTDHTFVCMRVAKKKKLSLKATGHEGVDVINCAQERNQWQFPCTVPSCSVKSSKFFD